MFNPPNKLITGAGVVLAKLFTILRLRPFPVCGLALTLLWSPSPAGAQEKASSNAPSTGVLPDQAHAMADVGYHFANLWFAGDQENWPLANYCLEQTQAHLLWAVQIRPVRLSSSGAKVNLNGILEAVTNTFLKAVGSAIETKDLAGFRSAYRQTMVGCYACHTACDKPFLRLQIPPSPAAPILNFAAADALAGGPAPTDDASLGKTFFQQNCALCHANSLGPRNMAVGGQGPSLVGVLGRRAGSAPNFNYTKPLADSGITWNAATLDHFLANPIAAVPGTTMMVYVPDAINRRHLVAYLSTLTASAAPAPGAEISSASVPAPENDPGAWLRDFPGAKHRVDLAALPAPFSTPSSGNGPHVVQRPAATQLAAPTNFSARLFAAGLSGPRLLRVAPNGDIFIAETRENRVRVLRAADGADAPSENQVFASGLNRPFGIAFYPSGNEPQWVYIANVNSIIRIPYQNGDLKARDAGQVVVPTLTQSTGGHTTRDVAFSKDDKRMFISIGSGSDIPKELEKKSPEAIAAWQAEHGFGACWGFESNRANIVVTDPEAHQPTRIFATGIRNGASMAVNPETGDLWVSTNERDGLGDDLVPDYITIVKDGAFYGWPWFYMGNHEDPRHAGERPDLAGKATIPDVPLQPHSATLEMTFYNATSGAAVFPADYHGDIFAAFHGSGNRSNRTGSKVVRVRCHNGVATGEYEDFLTGFVIDNTNVWGRPVGVAVAHDGALLVTEDANNTLWRVSYGNR